ncbi:MAG: PrsW family glutamic-type intramembrane protease [Treponema sp.]|nr:PrsW family glutamic-type intramembrane protease [Treponema sp.]
MAGAGFLVALVGVSAIPAILVFFWFRRSAYPISSRLFLLCFVVGASAVFVALVLGAVFSGAFSFLAARAGLWVEIFFRAPLVEELSRLLLFIPLFCLFSRFGAWNTALERGASARTMGRACGLVAGLGFGALESAIYGASYPMNALLRAFTSTPLHAACGARVGSAVAIFRDAPLPGAAHFLSAVAIHGVYNYLILSPGRLTAWVAIFVALSALASSAQLISRGMRASESG